MFFVASAIFLLNIFGLTSSMPGGLGAPENITITFLNPTTVRVSWATTLSNVDKYDITYKPTDARVVAIVAGNSDAVTLSNLNPDTQYQLTVSAVWGGRKYRSRPIVFRTLEPPRSSPQQESMAVAAGVSATSHTTIITSTTSTTDSSTTKLSSTETYVPVDYPQTSSTVRGVEIGIVLIVLVVWVAAIALFFNRWGKIRMLLPYQPDYKQEQLKVPGTAACAAAVATGNICTHHTPATICQQVHAQPPRTPRPRMNSAIFVSNSGPGIDPKEFFRRYGSVSKLCRKARSVDNISLEEKHFGLPTLSISGPSPPENDEEDEEEETEMDLMESCIP
ncbi:uncharacterized protein LOC109546629 isoform X2 [Dendroctonus ponderosae]|uniref:Fibronectin type-III domain-containing protein n=1 Tax=Dendroctonus ponderosae TaxID=77166 RepID=A0AAR5QJ05_DENPD|nr:uncharacterized protein LOC109546629 isoform X2 [Dendroctonus ponderosae]KAH1017592.1 hypothetical protein HUJ05_008209 [Dendroctonus ponderosae]